MQGRMARHDIRNDGIGPYAVFYCDNCHRDFRAQPPKGSAAPVVKDAAKSAFGSLFGHVPIVSDVLNAQDATDPRYITALTAEQLSASWAQMADTFHECPTCRHLVCPTDWDAQSGSCVEDSPRKAQIAQADVEQAAAVAKSWANAFGIGQAVAGAQPAPTAARCAKCGAATGTARFCPECGTPVAQAAATCRSCGAETKGAKFCPECGTKQA